MDHVPHLRKTNATILDDATLSAWQIADQLGHARPSLTMDVYMGRGAKSRAAAAALELALTPDAPDAKEWWVSWTAVEPGPRGRALDLQSWCAARDSNPEPSD